MIQLLTRLFCFYSTLLVHSEFANFFSLVKLLHYQFPFNLISNYLFINKCYNFFHISQSQLHLPMGLNVQYIVNMEDGSSSKS